MARAQGARAQMALAFETTYGTPPVGGFTKMPFASTSLGAEQPLLNSELLGYGRDPLAPIKDAVTADGDVVVPLDAEAFGFWLKAAFGDPTTTGTGPWTHEFQSGSWTLPSMSIETGMPEVPRFARAVQTALPDAPPDILCVDPIRNLFDGGPDGGGENDNTAMMFFLKERVEVLRDHIDPDCGVILIHHTKKLSKQQVKDDPFLALSGASALRGFYTSGLILHRPDEDCSQRKLEIELRNGPALPPKVIDKVGGQWVEINPMNERLVRQEVGAKHDAERDRKRDVILSILIDEAAEGKLYTSTQFREAFENQRGLGSQFTIRDRINVLATKGDIRFLRDGTAFGHSVVRSRFGYLCAEGMEFGREGRIDPETGEVLDSVIPVVPSHYKSPSNGQCMDLEDPSDWSIREDENG